MEKLVQLNYINDNLYLMLEDDCAGADEIRDIILSKCDINSVKSVTLSSKFPIFFDYYRLLLDNFENIPKFIEVIDFLPEELLELSQICDKIIVNLDLSLDMNLDEIFSAIALLPSHKYRLKLFMEPSQAGEVKRLLDKYGISTIYVEDPETREKFIELGFVLDND